MPADRYHHGNLRQALLQEAGALIREQGVDALSLRRLAERAGVSRSALYHHFRDKHDLLCAVAAQGFAELERLIDAARLESAPELRGFVRAYIAFAADYPERYELMFGRSLWKQATPTEELRAVAYRSFRRYVERIGALVQQAPAAAELKPLRIAQASWASLHGLCRLLIDGIYVDRADMEEVSEQVVQLLAQALY